MVAFGLKNYISTTFKEILAREVVINEKSHSAIF